jgi:hypothetical protein
MAEFFSGSKEMAASLSLSLTSDSRSTSIWYYIMNET